MPEQSNLQEYDKLTKKLKQALNKKKTFDEQLTKIEEDIFNKETKYLSDGVNQGNIIKGFENFTKASIQSSSHGANRNKKITFTDDDRIFSLSSSTYVRHLKKVQAGLNPGSSSMGSMEDDIMDDIDNDVSTSSSGTGNLPTKKNTKKSRD